jgi:hypothetical protein
MCEGLFFYSYRLPGGLGGIDPGGGGIDPGGGGIDPGGGGIDRLKFWLCANAGAAYEGIRLRRVKKIAPMIAPVASRPSGM